MECGNESDAVQIRLFERQLSWFIKDEITVRCCRENLLPYIKYFASVLKLLLCLVTSVKLCFLDTNRGVLHRMLM
jgi:hypothetical protein